MSQNGDTLYSTLQVPPAIVTYSHIDAAMLQINSSGALLNHGDIMLEGKLMNNSYEHTPSLQFNGSAINVSSTVINTNSGVVFSNTRTGIPFSAVLPTTSNCSWVLPGRLYYTNTLDSNGSTIKVLCIV